MSFDPVAHIRAHEYRNYLEERIRDAKAKGDTATDPLRILQEKSMQAAFEHALEAFDTMILGTEEEGR